MPSLKSLENRILSIPAFGIPVAKASRLLGMTRLARKAAKRSSYAPPIVRVAIPGEGLPGGRLAMHSAGGRNRVAAGLWIDGWSGYEPRLPELFFHTAGAASCVVDVGAHTGYYALLALAASGTSKVVACEPFPPALEWLHKNIELNEAADRTVVMPCAVSDFTGESRLYVPKNRFTGIETSSSLNPRFRDDHSDVIDIEVVTLDGLAASRGLRVDVLKIDVESQEHRVLAGAGTVLAECRPIIFLEVLDSADHEALEGVRREHGYTVYRITSDRLTAEKAVEHRPGSPNQVLCPDEKIDRLRGVAARCGLKMS